MALAQHLALARRGAPPSDDPSAEFCEAGSRPHCHQIAAPTSGGGERVWQFEEIGSGGSEVEPLAGIRRRWPGSRCQGERLVRRTAFAARALAALMIATSTTTTGGAVVGGGLAVLAGAGNRGRVIHAGTWGAGCEHGQRQPNRGEPHHARRPKTLPHSMHIRFHQETKPTRLGFYQMNPPPPKSTWLLAEVFGVNCNLVACFGR